MPQPMHNATPVSESFQMQTLNRLFDRLIQLTTWSCAAYSVIILLIGGDWSRLFAPALIGCGGPACNVLRKRFSDRMGFSVYIWSIWIAIAVQSGLRGGILNPILHGCVILVLMGGWLLGMRQALFLLLASISWIAVLAFVAGTGDWIPIAVATGGAYWLPMTTVWVVGHQSGHQRGQSRL